MGMVSYGKTKIACYLGYITQAISINLLPLLYVTFQEEFFVSLSHLGLLATAIFVVQIVVDLLAVRFGHRLSYRAGCVAAHVLATAGLVLLSFLPALLPNPYVGVLVASVLLSVGGGLTEVLISPVMDAIPSVSKAGEMSLLHSFYCWGVAGVTLVSTIFFAMFGTEYWRWLMLLWACVPALTTGLFCVVPLPPKPEETIQSQVVPIPFGVGALWLIMALMLFAGASEMAPSQWASFFAEHGLKVPKAVGDLLGPCAFAVCQGTARVVFARMSHRHDLRRMLLWHAMGCVMAYAVIVLIPYPMVALLGFCLCGWCVGPMWPGVLSLSSERFPAGGTAMFALLALCGDMGCAMAPWMVGVVTDRLTVGHLPALAMRGGFAVCMLFPVGLVMGFMLLRTHPKAK